MSPRDPNYDPELAKQIMADVKARRGRGAVGPVPGDGTGLPARFRVGFIGTEPLVARQPVARTYIALWGTLIAVLVTLAGSVAAGGAVIIAAALIGIPKLWTWSHDRPGAGLWVIGLAVTLGGEITWLTGGAAAHGTLSHHFGSTTALVLTVIGGFVLVLSGFRRWGTGGSSVGGTTPRNADEAAVLAEAGRREGAGRER